MMVQYPFEVTITEKRGDGAAPVRRARAFEYGGAAFAYSEAQRKRPEVSRVRITNTIYEWSKSET